MTAFSGCATPEELTICPVELLYEPTQDDPHSPVEVVGDFNDWTPGATPLIEQPDGTYRVSIDVSPGDHSYRLRVGDALILDPRAPLTRFDAQDREQSQIRVPDCRAPTFEVLEAQTTSEGSLTIEVAFTPGIKGHGLDPTSVVATLIDGKTLTTEATARSGREFIAVDTIGLQAGKHTIRIAGRDRSGRGAEDVLLPLWVEAEPFDWHDAVIYQVIIDRFASSGGPLDIGMPHEEAITRRFGGDLAGLTAVVESGYFEDLGVRVLWISPLYDNPDDLWPWYLGLSSSAYHGYWPISPRQVEPVIGGEDGAHRLIEAAHERGLRVILDVVPNHVHTDHPYFAEHRGDGWFNGLGDCVCGSSCSWAYDLDHCWFSEYLADLRWKNPEVARQVVADTLFWLETFDVDGLRIDAIPMMPLLATRELVYAVRQRFERGPGSIHLLGETYIGPGEYETIARSLGPFGLDGQFEFPLLWELRRVLARGEGSMIGLDQVVRESEEAWETAGGGHDGRAVMSPFIGNHDVPRFISEAADDNTYEPIDDPPSSPDRDEPYQRLLLAHTLTMTLPGAPVLYYGDELGMPGATDPDNRRPMRFGEDLNSREQNALERVARLGRLRACLPSLRRGDRRTLLVEDDLYVYLRDAGDGSPAIVILNRSEEPQMLDLELPEELEFSSDHLVDALTGTEASLSDSRLGPLSLPSLSSMVLVPTESGCGSP